jgi:urease accessory protein
LTVIRSANEPALESDLARRLKLLQLADSGVPIGSLAHSFGLESMIDEQLVGVDDLYSYLRSLLAESLMVEAVYCRTAHGCAGCNHRLAGLNAQLSAWRPARESRDASLALGKRFLKLVASLDPSPQIERAAALGEIHFSIAFGFACGAMRFPDDETVAAFLHQNIAASLSAAQRLLPLGQVQSSRIAWDLKTVIEGAVNRSAALGVESVPAFSHLPELASMRHPSLGTRLFIS